MILHCGYQRYSSWSLRVWLLLRVMEIDFDCQLYYFKHNDRLKRLAREKKIPAQVPVLEDRGLVIWDSLAIMEYLAEYAVDKPLWPASIAARTTARAVAAEMHSGFFALRSECPMDCVEKTAFAPSIEVEKELRRLAELFQYMAECKDSNGDFLFGEFGIVDAMLAPLIFRVQGYGLQVDAKFDRWAEAMLALPALQAWQTLAQDEARVIASAGL